MPQELKSLIDAIKILFDVIGILLVFWGGIGAAWTVFKLEIVQRKNSIPIEESARGFFAGKMILALEFFIAVDIINTIEEPTWNSLGMLASLVLLRSVLNYFLKQEINIIKAASVVSAKRPKFFTRFIKK